MATAELMKWPGDPEWKKAVEACMAVLEDEARPMT
ncbi:hypothetical protein BQ8794_220001 [Mesorhizobium prunaredense]|uniref:DUF982 domain-containing protein n=1 Tax=Mesorhizobium prunaredense TaxID=1631249 RepID=A0A1R3V9G3_9HYPH|nr:hypothetical protein BQ8794_220001 [Mesorhizobium prunaredense]